MDPLPSWAYGVLFVGLMVANVLVWRHKLGRAVAQGVVRRDDADQFIRGVGGGLLAFAAAHALLVTVTRITPLCLATRPLSDPQWTPVLVIHGALITVTLAWVYAFGGGELMARVSPGLSRRSPGPAWSPVQAKVAITVVLALMLVAPLVLIPDGDAFAGFCAPAGP